MCRTILYEISSNQDEKNINLVVTQKYKQCPDRYPGDKDGEENYRACQIRLLRTIRLTVIGSVASEFTYSHESIAERILYGRYSRETAEQIP